MSEKRIHIDGQCFDWLAMGKECLKKRKKKKRKMNNVRQDAGAWVKCHI